MHRRKIVVGVFSAAGYHDRRQACLDTWADLGQREDVDLVFVVGDPDCGFPRREDAVLYLPCPDNYECLPQKTRWLCLWALANYEFDYLFKCDDDTYVDIDRLLACDATADYVGHDIGGYASGGAGYLMSRNAALCVAGRLTATEGYEDMLAGQAIQQAGVPFTPDSRFDPGNARWPSYDNDLITSHYCPPGQIRQIHARRHLRPSSA